MPAHCADRAHRDQSHRPGRRAADRHSHGVRNRPTAPAAPAPDTVAEHRAHDCDAAEREAGQVASEAQSEEPGQGESAGERAGTYQAAERISSDPASSYGTLIRYDVRVEDGLSVDPDKAAVLIQGCWMIRAAGAAPVVGGLS